MKHVIVSFWNWKCWQFYQILYFFFLEKIILLKFYYNYNKDVRKQLIQLCTRMGIPTNSSCGNEYEIVIKCMLCGFFRNSAILQPTSNYKTIFSNQVKIFFFFFFLIFFFFFLFF